MLTDRHTVSNTVSNIRRTDTWFRIGTVSNVRRTGTCVGYGIECSMDGQTHTTFNIPRGMPRKDDEIFPPFSNLKIVPYKIYTRETSNLLPRAQDHNLNSKLRDFSIFHFIQNAPNSIRDITIRSLVSCQSSKLKQAWCM